MCDSFEEYGTGIDWVPKLHHLHSNGQIVLIVMSTDVSHACFYYAIFSFCLYLVVVLIVFIELEELFDSLMGEKCTFLLMA